MGIGEGRSGGSVRVRGAGSLLRLGGLAGELGLEVRERHVDEMIDKTCMVWIVNLCGGGGEGLGTNMEGR